jgi:hypothetical protein
MSHGFPLCRIISMHQAALRQANDFAHGGIINHAKFQHRCDPLEKYRAAAGVDVPGDFHDGS